MHNNLLKGQAIITNPLYLISKNVVLITISDYLCYIRNNKQVMLF